MPTPRLPAFSISWNEGRFFDFWMVVHLVAGFTGATTNVLWGWETPRVYAVGITLMLVWEGAEWLVGIRESWENRTLDVAVGLAGIALAQWFVAPLERAQRQSACGVALGVLAILSTAGWLAYRRRRGEPRGQS